VLTTFLAFNQESLSTMSLRLILEGLSLIIAGGRGLGVSTSEGVGSDSDDAESEDADTTAPTMEEISDDLELQVLEPPVASRDGFPQMARASLVVRGERAPKL
jgi:hypothetical protein